MSVYAVQGLLRRHAGVMGRDPRGQSPFVGRAQELALLQNHLAHHALRGEVWGKAVTYCQQAGAKALARSAYREAVRWWEQALEALTYLPPDRTTMEQAIDLCCDLQQAPPLLAQYEQILTHLYAAERLAEGLGDQRRLGNVCIRIADIHRMMQYPQRGICRWGGLW